MSTQSRESSPLNTTPTQIENEQVCSLCNGQFKQPRVLSCLHVFCEDCLEKYLKPQTEENEAQTSEHSSPNTTRTTNSTLKPTSIMCPNCDQETKLSSKGVGSLCLDYVTCNQLDASALENMQLVCTSCKAKEKAVARCIDCASFLCPNCVTAHQYMRCFEDHKVLSFEELKSSGDSLSIHKPITCISHPDELIKYYCLTCQVPICNECVVMDHKQPTHHYESTNDVELKQREELQNLTSESKSKVHLCEEATSNLQSCLSELQMQRDNAKSHIQETFHSYKAILEKVKDDIIEELDSWHSSEELRIMDTFHQVEKTIEKIEDATKFAERLLKKGNSLELLALKQVVCTQLLSLINNTPKLDNLVELKFETNETKFKEAVKEAFGQLKKPYRLSKSSTPPCGSNNSIPQDPSPLPSSSSFDSESFSFPTSVLSPENPLPPLEMNIENDVLQYNLTQLALAMEQGGTLRTTGHPPPVPPVTTSTLAAVTSTALAALMLDNNTTAGPDLSLTSLSTLNNKCISKPLETLTSDVTAIFGSDVGRNTTISKFNNLGQMALNGPVLGPSLESPNTSGSSPTSQAPSLSLPPIDINGTPSPSILESPLINGGPTLSTLARSIAGASGNILSPTAPLVRASELKISPHSASSLSPVSVSQPFNPTPRSATLKTNPMQIRCKFGQLGPGKCQFSSPHGFCLGIDEDIVVADTNNHRIQVFTKTGEFKFQFGIQGKEEGQFWYPRKVAVIRSSGKYVVCDRGSERSRMQIFTKNGHFVKKIAIRYIDIVAGLAITGDDHIVAVDSVSPTVFIISELGDLIFWFDCSEYMREPSDIAINGKEYYICDFKGHCITVFSDEGQYLRRIGSESITNFPNGIDISDAGDILVGDSHGNRFHVVVFSNDGTLLSEFECPYVKVSRCCGLKITSEGYIVTLAKNNHHVLVLNTLYIV